MENQHRDAPLCIDSGGLLIGAATKNKTLGCPTRLGIPVSRTQQQQKGAAMTCKTWLQMAWVAAFFLIMFVGLPLMGF